MDQAGEEQEIYDLIAIVVIDSTSPHSSSALRLQSKMPFEIRKYACGHAAIIDSDNRVATRITKHVPPGEAAHVTIGMRVTPAYEACESCRTSKPREAWGWTGASTMVKAETQPIHQAEPRSSIRKREKKQEDYSSSAGETSVDSWEGGTDEW
ncbi:hypothetical protein BDV96DRAFT_607465 [Lophiotrema nucula]|uniref:Uncharacterized protein n=1 Tax=Lophiotrema nucula TaxID=690887 RepID=A0A6A5YJM6_9PLEO|nr:hypothetical protein BDV96DRAFT_607465 [Lophiotrema nucula]